MALPDDVENQFAAIERANASIGTARNAAIDSIAKQSANTILGLANMSVTKAALTPGGFLSESDAANVASTS